MKNKRTLILFILCTALLASCTQLTPSTTRSANATLTPYEIDNSQSTPTFTKTFVPTEDITIQKVATSSWNGIPIIAGAIEGKFSDSSYSYYVNNPIEEAETYYLDKMQKEGWAFAGRGAFGTYRIILYFYQDNQNAKIDLTKFSLNESRDMLSVSIEISTSPFYSDVRSTQTNSSGITLEGAFWLTWRGLDVVKPIGSNIQLRQKDNQELIFTNESLWFRFEDIPPGKYELWVFIDSWIASFSNCYNIGLPDENWEFRKIADDGKIEVVDGLSFREVIYPETDGTNTSIDGLYAVLDNLVLTSGTANTIYPAFICESH